VGVLGPLIWFELMMMKVMGLTTVKPPDVPGCFAENTPVELFITDSRKSLGIKHIKIGDILKNGSVVTAILKCSAEEQHLYKLNKVLVTGEHRVFHPVLKWIKVKDHPASVHMPEFSEPFVYCLGTDKKEFTIGDFIFSDWDDIDARVLEDLQNNCVKHGYLPNKFTYKDIHTHLDCGFHYSSKVALDNGETVNIKDVKVNDLLLSGDKVVSIIKIAGHDVSSYTYSFINDSRTICGTKNIQINDDNLGVINAMDYARTNPLLCEPLIKKEEYMYHLLTDTSFFNVNNIRVSDYNSGIDKYLRM
jgi:hypothetical protein